MTTGGSARDAGAGRESAVVGSAVTGSATAGSATAGSATVGAAGSAAGGGPGAQGPVCVLVGPPGSGKTTVGELVAAALRLTFRDTDTDIVAAAGKPIPEIFFDDGEPHFRKLEAEAVATALETFDGVLALGAGAILAAPTRALLTAYPVVYLEVGFADAIGRVGLGSGRPLLAMNPRATLRRLLDERRPLYEEVARHTIATDGLTAEEVAAEVVRVIRG